jgi:fructosamine-3-kinase
VAEPALEQALAAAIARSLGRPDLRLVSMRPLGGGCINSASRLETDVGTFFAKWNAEAPADFFLREADGLAEMALAESGLAIPRVLAATGPKAPLPGFLITEFLEPKSSGAGGPDDDEALGRGLAKLHQRTAARFGFPTDTYCGATRQPNTWCDTWPAFYADRRIRPLVEAIERERGLPAVEARLYDRFVALLPDLLPPLSKPSLIHGDLWSGNVLRTTRGPGLVDPSCAYADREMEFGITTLFGGLSDRAWSAYLEAAPLDSGWRDRTPVYQLYHLLNHHLLFGGGYGAQALAIARRYV